MALYCENCGSELIAGQKFCRSCGTPTGNLSEEQASTRMMPPPPTEAATRGLPNTAPTSKPNPNPVYTPPAYYQPQAPPMYPAQQMPQYAPTPSRSPWVGIISVIGVFVLAILLAIGFIVNRVQKAAEKIRDAATSIPQQPPQPPLPGEQVLSEDNGENVSISPQENTFKKTFPVTDTLAFSLANVNGDITVESWDKPQAEVKIIKRGGSQQDRKSNEVRYTNSKGTLTFRTAQNQGSRGVEVRYEIKLPHD